MNSGICSIELVVDCASDDAQVHEQVSNARDALLRGSVGRAVVELEGLVSLASARGQKHVAAAALASLAQIFVSMQRWSDIGPLHHQRAQLVDEPKIAYGIQLDAARLLHNPIPNEAFFHYAAAHRLRPTETDPLAGLQQLWSTKEQLQTYLECVDQHAGFCSAAHRMPDPQRRRHAAA